METTAFTIVAFIVGLVIGFVIKLALDNRDAAAGSSHEINNLRKEYREYQAQVSRHLKQSADMINSIQNQYGEVQAHIFSAAQELNREDNKQNALQPNSHFVSYGESEVIEPPKVEDKKSGPPKDYAG